MVCSRRLLQVSQREVDSACLKPWSIRKGRFTSSSCAMPTPASSFRRKEGVLCPVTAHSTSGTCAQKTSSRDGARPNGSVKEGTATFSPSLKCVTAASCCLSVLPPAERGGSEGKASRAIPTWAGSARGPCTPTTTARPGTFELFTAAVDVGANRWRAGHSQSEC